jgi:hypothetical protein
MSSVNWKSQMDAALAGVNRDLHSMGRDVKQYIAALDTTERLVLLGLAFIGLFYLLIRHFRNRTEGEQAEQKFAGLLFVIVAFGVGLVWIGSGHRIA